ncbi:MAG: hypothetical protein U9R19_10285 [Bacteroidota bacterium]|nr:hypothetical protein [Bacteroidota bacterium]
MYKRYAVLVFFCFLSFLPLLAQKNTGGGIHLSYLANYNRFYLSQHSQYTSILGINIDEKRELRSPEVIPEQYLAAYQFGFINHKKTWHDFRFSFIFMPKTKKIYKEYKPEGQDWQLFDDADSYIPVNMEMFLINIAHIYKINLIAHHFYLNLGLGGGGGVIRWPSANEEGSDYYFLTYFGYPIGGIEILLGKHIGLNLEYHYQWGQSVSQAVSIYGGKINWEYKLEGHELSAGLNLYF